VKRAVGIDLDNFPTSATARRMMSRITPIYGKSYVAKWIFEVMGCEVDAVKGRMDELRLQTSPETATWGLKYWEQRYGIYPGPASLEERRRRVRAKRIARMPMNPERMSRILSAAYGCPAGVEENVAPYTFRVELERDGAIPLNLMDLLALIHEIKPAHQTCRICFSMGQKVYASAGQWAVYRPAAIMDGYSVQRETVLQVRHSAAVAQVSRRAVRN